jgi:hypothetical protein
MNTLIENLYILTLLGIILISSYVTDEIGIAFYEQQEKQAGKIFDLIHEITPDLHRYEDIVNLIPLTLMISFFAVPTGLALIQEFALRFLFIVFLRSLTIMTTILPKHEKCTKRFTMSTIFSGQCYDKVFSGHTAFVFLLTLLFLRDGYIPFWFFVVINIAQASLILLTRSHYTIDVVFAFLITYLVYDKDISAFVSSRG